MAEVDFKGLKVQLSDYVSPLALMKFASAAEGGADTDTIEGMAALYEVLQELVSDDQWRAFSKHVTKARASGEDLLDFAGEAMVLLLDRPTEQPSDSSGGLQTIEPSSTADSSSRVIDRFERSGRPDLALLVQRTTESRAAG